LFQGAPMQQQSSSGMMASQGGMQQAPLQPGFQRPPGGGFPNAQGSAPPRPQQDMSGVGGCSGMGNMGCGVGASGPGRPAAGFPSGQQCFSSQPPPPSGPPSGQMPMLNQFQPQGMAQQRTPQESGKLDADPPAMQQNGMPNGIQHGHLQGQSDGGSMDGGQLGGAGFQAQDASPPPLAVGDAVEAQCEGWGDSWYPGSVRELLANGEIQVLWDGDQPSISNVRRALVRRRGGVKPLTAPSNEQKPAEPQSLPPQGAPAPPPGPDATGTAALGGHSMMTQPEPQMGQAMAPQTAPMAQQTRPPLAEGMPAAGAMLPGMPAGGDLPQAQAQGQDADLNLAHLRPPADASASTAAMTRLYRYDFGPGDDINGPMANLRRRVEVELKGGYTIEVSLNILRPEGQHPSEQSQQPQQQMQPQQLQQPSGMTEPDSSSRSVQSAMLPAANAGGMDQSGGLPPQGLAPPQQPQPAVQSTWQMPAAGLMPPAGPPPRGPPPSGPPPPGPPLSMQPQASVPMQQQQACGGLQASVGMMAKQPAVLGGVSQQQPMESPMFSGASQGAMGNAGYQIPGMVPMTSQTPQGFARLS